MPIPTAVLKHWDPMIGLDFHMAINPGGPPPLFVTPVPMTPHVVAGVLMWGPWGLLGKGKSEPSVRTFHGDVMLRGTDMGYLIPHISIPPTNLLMPVWTGLSSSKSEFSVASVRCADGPVAIAILVFIGVNLDCQGTTIPVDLPTGRIIAVNTHFAGFTFGDFVAGIVMMGIDIAISAFTGWVGSGLGKALMKTIGRRLISPIVKRVFGESVEEIISPQLVRRIMNTIGGKIVGSAVSEIDNRAAPGDGSVTDALQDGISRGVNSLTDSISDYFNNPAVDERP